MLGTRAPPRQAPRDPRAGSERPQARRNWHAEGLDPETYPTFDLGVRARYPSWQASAFVFYTLIDDLIGRVPSSLTPADLTLPPGTIILEKDNLGDGWVYGFEIALAYRLLEEVTVFGDWGYAKGRADRIKSAAPPFEIASGTTKVAWISPEGEP